MFRPQIKVLDCTVRDGGLINQWQFSDDFVRKVFLALSKAGVDYMEIGYKSSEKYFSRQENGAWKFCAEEDLRKIVGDDDRSLKLSAMADVGRIDHDDIPHKRDSVLDMIRVACYVKEVDKAISLAHDCIDKGYETTINLMAVSKVLERDLDEALDDLSKSDVPAVYIVDSFGAMYSEQIHSLAKKYFEALPGKDLGIHTHNNQQLAFANTIEAIIAGVNRIDATLYGMGRGAGNCPLELLLAFLKNPKFDIRPVFEVIQDTLIPLKAEVEWGYHIPYMITGILNEHPRSGMKAMAAEEMPDLRQFYESLRDESELD
jgi:4-hydroxy 2-oxovalerate aldolase